jgi:hypothetical protein
MVPKQRARVQQATILTLATAVFLAVMGILLGTTAFVLCALTVPFPLTLLWLSADAPRAV